MNKKTKNQLAKIFSEFPQIKLAYFFGSRAAGSFGPLSDYDFAFYLDEQDSNKRFDIRLKLDCALSDLFGTNDIDIVILNDAEMPDLKFNILNDGILIYEKEPYRVLIEPRIISEYIDFNDLIAKYGLTKTPR